MKRNRFKQQLLSMVEGALMLALAFALDIACKLIPGPFPYGGGISVSVLPIIYFAYRRGTAWGLSAGAVFAVLQIITGWYLPPAGTWWAVLLCVLLDYLLAFSAAGLAPLFARPFGQKRVLGYAVGSAAVGVLRFLCSFASGVILWDSYAPDGMNVWLYSLVYNGGYMLPNTVLITLLTVALSLALDPLTLRPMRRSGETL